MPFIVTITRITHNMSSPQYFIIDTKGLIRAVACYVTDAAFTRKNLLGLYCVAHKITVALSCHRWSPQNWSPRTICGKLCCYGWSPRTKYGCHRWSPRTICGTVSGPPLPQMVPLKLSLEMMSRGSYEVNLANMDRVIIIIIYFSLCIASCSSYRRPSSVDTHTA